MAKLLAAGGVVLLGLLVFLVLQLNSSSETSAAAPIEKPASGTLASTTGGAIVKSAAPAEAVKPVEEGKVKKLDPQSDAFFFQFDEIVPGKMNMAAAECYHGGLDRKHRNSKLRIAFDNVIKDGVVRIENLKVLPIGKDEMGLNDPAMESCMVQKMAAVVWTNEALPDGTYDDRLVIRPERGMKKWTKENLAYEGDGPIGKAVMKPGQAPPKSDTATRDDFERSESEKE